MGFFNKVKKVGSRKVSIKTTVLTIAMCLFAITAIAARYEVLTVGTLQVNTIEKLSSNYTLDLTDPRFSGTIINREEPTIVDMGGTSVYLLTRPGTYWIDDFLSTDGTRNGSGVSIQFPNDIDSDSEGVYRIQKMTGLANIDTSAGCTPYGTGTTPIVISVVPWTSGTTVGIWTATSGGTQEVTSKEPCEIFEIDAAGDFLEFIAVDGGSSGGDTIYQTGRYIQ